MAPTTVIINSCQGMEKEKEKEKEEGTAAEKGARLGERENKRRENGLKTNDGSGGENTRRGWWRWEEGGEDGDKTGGDEGRRAHAEGQNTHRTHDKGSWGWSLVSLPRLPRGLCRRRETAGGLFPAFSSSPPSIPPPLLAVPHRPSLPWQHGASRAIQERAAAREDRKVGKREVWRDSLLRHSNPEGSGCSPPAPLAATLPSKDVAAKATVICKHLPPELFVAWWVFTTSWKCTSCVSMTVCFFVFFFPQKKLSIQNSYYKCVV